MQLWLEDRLLADNLVYERVCKFPAAAFSKNPWRVVYTYKANEDVPMCRCACLPSELVYHGTSFTVFARILHTNRLHASNLRLNLGMESHHSEPAVYTAATVDHALNYAWPSSALDDNVYNRVVLHCEISPHVVMRRHKGETLVHEGHVFIRKVFPFQLRH